MKWHKKMGIMSTCGLSLLTITSLGISLTSCSKNEVVPEEVPYQYNYMKDMRLMLSDKAKLTVNGVKKQCLLFQINDSKSDVNKAWFTLIEDIANNELFLSFQGWANDKLLEENKKWSGKIPKEIELTKNNIDLIYNGKKIESLPVKAVNIGDLTSIPDWKKFDENTKNLDYCNNGIYINKQFILNFATANNIEYIYPHFIIFDDNTSTNIKTNYDINIKFPSSIKWLGMGGEIGFNQNLFNNAFPNIILNLSDCNKLVEIQNSSALLIQNLIEIKLSSTIKRYSGSIYRPVNNAPKTPVKINLENLLFINKMAFWNNYFPNNEVVLNDNCKYCHNSFNFETNVIGGIQY